MHGRDLARSRRCGQRAVQQPHWVHESHDEHGSWSSARCAYASQPCNAVSDAQERAARHAHPPVIARLANIFNELPRRPPTGKSAIGSTRELSSRPVHCDAISVCAETMLKQCNSLHYWGRAWYALMLARTSRATHATVATARSKTARTLLPCACERRGSQFIHGSAAMRQHPNPAMLHGVHVLRSVENDVQTAAARVQPALRARRVSDLKRV